MLSALTVRDGGTRNHFLLPDDDAAVVGADFFSLFFIAIISPPQTGQGFERRNRVVIQVSRPIEYHWLRYRTGTRRSCPQRQASRDGDDADSYVPPQESANRSRVSWEMVVWSNN